MSKQEKNVKRTPSGNQSKLNGAPKTAIPSAAKQQKQSKPSKKSGELSGDVKREQKLQAIILMDNNLRGNNATSLQYIIDCPPSITDVTNLTILEFNFEFLAQNGVEEIIVVALSLAEEIDALIDRSKWSSLISIRCVSLKSCSTEGDALRELDSMNIIRSDPFVLMSGNTISNINLKNAIYFHKQKRAEDPNNVMTVVLKNQQRSECFLQDLSVAIDRQTGQLLLFENHSSDGEQSDNARKLLRIPLELMDEHEEMVLHSDLQDCRIDICSPEFLLQFSDNFDYQDVRKDFVRNEVCNWSLGKHIFGFVAERSEYVAFISDPWSLQAVARDVAARWMFPLVPDSCIMDCTTQEDSQKILRVEQLPNHSYKGVNARVSRSAVIGEGVFVGSGTNVGDGAAIHRSVVGKDCVIGAQVVVEDSLIMDGARVDSGARISGAIVGREAVVMPCKVVSKGCVVQRSGAKDLNEGDGSLVACSSSSWPVTCKRRELAAMLPPEEEDDEDEEDDGEAGGGPNADMAFSMSDGNHPCGSRPGRLERGDEEEERCMDTDFLQVVGEMVSTGFEEGHPAESLLLEVKGCKFAQNKSYADCLEGIVPSLLQICANFAHSGGDPSVFKSAAFLTKWRELVKTQTGWGRSLIRPLVQDWTEEVALIRAMESFALGVEYRLKVAPIFRFILQVVYEEELVGEDGFDRWIEARSSCGPVQQQGGIIDSSGDSFVSRRQDLFFGPQVQVFVQWLQKDDDEDEDEDEDEENDDDDDDDADDDDADDDDA